MHVMFRCKLKPDAVAHNLELLDAVYEELAAVRPAGLRYSTYQLDDQVTFVAIAELENGPGLLQGLAAFQRYRADLEQRCAEPPAMTVMREVGSYHGR